MKVHFVGAGSGDPELITLKGRRLLDEADLILYTGSLVNPKLLAGVKADVVNSHGMKLEEIVELMADRAKKGKRVVRLQTGDPSLYSAMYEQMRELDRAGIEYEVVPGVTSAFAAAASIKAELTLGGETVIITRPAGKTLQTDQIRELSRNNATLAIFLGVHKLKEVVETVEMPADTPAAVVYRASWEDEKVVCGTLSDITAKVEEAGIERTAIILIGKSLDPDEYKRSYLYG